MKHSHCCRRARSIPLAGARFAPGKRSATYCRIAAFSVSRSPSSVRSVGTMPSGLIWRKSEPSGRRLVFGRVDVAGVGAGLVECDAGRHRAGERREIKIHANSPSFDFCTVPHEISWRQGFFAIWYKKRQDDAPKRRGRPRAYDPQTALARAADTFWKAGYAGTSLDDLAAATGHEPAEPLRGVRRQARTLSQDAGALPRRVSRAGAPDAWRTIRRCACSSSASTTRRSTSICGRGRRARLLLDRHGRDRGDGRSECARIPRRQHAHTDAFLKQPDRQGAGAWRDRARRRHRRRSPIWRPPRCTRIAIRSRAGLRAQGTGRDRRCARST